MAAWLRFKRSPWKKPQDLWNDVLWTETTKVEMLGRTHSESPAHHICGQTQRWRGNDLGGGHLPVIESTMNPAKICCIGNLSELDDRFLMSWYTKSWNIKGSRMTFFFTWLHKNLIALYIIFSFTHNHIHTCAYGSKNSCLLFIATKTHHQKSMWQLEIIEILRVY